MLAANGPGTPLAVTRHGGGVACAEPQLDGESEEDREDEECRQPAHPRTSPQGATHPEPSRVSLNSRATRGSGRASLRLALANGMRARMSRMTFNRAWCLSSARTSIHGACC